MEVSSISKKCICLVLLFLSSVMFVFPKGTFKDDKGGAGHADDISKLLTGKSYNNNTHNHKLLPILKGLTYIMHLTVDATQRTDPDILTYEVADAVKYLEQHQKELKMKSIPDARKIVTPGGPYHGEYTHLGWAHKSYTPETMEKWIVRQRILKDFLAGNFNFWLGNMDKLDSFAALFYYVHMLGDHAHNSMLTARTRIPIKSLDEQDDIRFDIRTYWERNGNNGNGAPTTTIIAELNKHLEILFKDQRNSNYYKNLIGGINGVLPESYNEDNAKDKIERARQIQVSQQAKAEYILNILFANVPYLLKEASFAKGFYAEMGR